MAEDIGAFDYIIIGAGSAGSVVANRLSEDPENRVLLLEAGPRDRSPWIHLPVGYYKTILNPAVTFQFETEPEPELVDRKIWWPRGRVLGGSSSINGLVYVRGQAEDFDHWRQLGNPGWSFDDVLPYFIRSEHREPGGTLRGRGGPLNVSDMTYEHPMAQSYIDACGQAGIGFNPDYNGERQEGVSHFQLTIKNGRRQSAAVAYLRDAEKRPNLRIITDAPTTKIAFDGRLACAVDFDHQGTAKRASVRREIILSAGAVSSPQVLMLSGIGDPDHLRAHGIDPVHELNGVGRNLQDHFQARTVSRCRQPVTLNDLQASLWLKAKAAIRWALTRSGPLTVGAGQIAVFARTRPELASPDVQFHVIMFSADKVGQKLHPFSGFTVSVCQLRPESVGRVSLRSGDPKAAPKIHANYLARALDRQTIVDGLKLARKINMMPEMAEYFASEELPGADVQSDDEFLDFARQTGGTIFHPTSTCMMGPTTNPMAVTDHRLRVHGLEGLRVADASIMPKMVSGNTNAPTIMIGEKAASMILEDQR